jgi:hypothetical protein
MENQQTMGREKKKGKKAHAPRKINYMGKFYPSPALPS